MFIIQAWWYLPAIPVGKRQRCEDVEFQDTLGFTVDLYEQNRGWKYSFVACMSGVRPWFNQ